MRQAEYAAGVAGRAAGNSAPVAIVVMVGSGLQIFNAYPSFHRKREPASPLRPFEGHPAPRWSAFGGWLAGGRWSHFAMMWVLVLNGLVYLGFVYLRSFDVERAGAPAEDAKRDPGTKTAALGAITPRAGATGDTSADKGRGANDADEAADEIPEGVPYAEDLAAGRGYHECWDAERALHPRTIVAYAIDGRALDAAPGAPARVHSPVKLGYKNTKYLTQVVFRTDRTGGYWTDQGYEWYGGT